MPHGNRQDVRGYGIGLYYVKHILEKMAGAYLLKVRRGTVQYSQLNSTDMKAKILFVEDERDLSLIVCDTLRQQGFDVVAAFDGIEGLAKYKTRLPT